MQPVEELFVNGIHPAVERLCFDTLNWKISKSEEAQMNEDDCKVAEAEYRKYLSLIKMYPDKELVPSKLVDVYWHAHILDTVAYEKDCKDVFGCFLHHYPYLGIYGNEDHEKLVSKYDETIRLYEQHFGEYPMDRQSASRCADHPCHATNAM